MGKYHKQDEIYKIVMDCRTSGLSDFQWCKANGVNPSSLYRWVEKLRTKGCDIPDKVKGSIVNNLPQKVVKLELSNTDHQHCMGIKKNASVLTNCSNKLVPVIEITVGELTTRFTNDVDHELLKATLHCLSNFGGSYVG